VPTFSPDAVRGRLDLDWRWHETALNFGCMMSINPDTHSTREIDLTHWGVEMARKGGVPKERVLNCLSGEGVCRISLAPTRSAPRQALRAPPHTRTAGAGPKKAFPTARKRKIHRQLIALVPAHLLASAFLHCVV
jgi:hypothetical protein